MLGGCGGAETALERSCAGERIAACAPFAYAVVRVASLTPDGVRVSDPTARVQVHVQLATCGARAPSAPRVRLVALGPSAGIADASGEGTAVVPLAELADDGATAGDPVARDDTIDATLDNPFFGGVVPDSRLRLRWTPFVDGCEGTSLETDYRVGPRWRPADP